METLSDVYTCICIYTYGMKIHDVCYVTLSAAPKRASRFFQVHRIVRNVLYLVVHEWGHDIRI